MADPAANSLCGRRIVVTRAADQAAALLDALRSAGAEPILMPMIAFAPPADLAAFAESLRSAKDCDWLVLTSQNAVRALSEQAAALSVSLAELFERAEVAAVGNSTADAARGAGLRVQHISTGQTGSALAAELGERLSGKLVYLPRSDRANPQLVVEFEELGARVRAVEAYRTLPPSPGDAVRFRDALLRGVDAVLFFSPSAVHHLKEMLGLHDFCMLGDRALFAAIGPITASALREAGVSRFETAAEPSTAAVVSLLQRHFSKSKATLPVGANRG